MNTPVMRAWNRRAASSPSRWRTSLNTGTTALDTAPSPSSARSAFGNGEGDVEEVGRGLREQRREGHVADQPEDAAGERAGGHHGGAARDGRPG